MIKLKKFYFSKELIMNLKYIFYENLVTATS